MITNEYLYPAATKPQRDILEARALEAHAALMREEACKIGARLTKENNRANVELALMYGAIIGGLAVGLGIFLGG